MKVSAFFSFLVLLFVSQFATAQNQQITDVETSRKVFEEGKKAHHNSYQFSTHTASFSGFWETVTYVVKEGKIVERHYQSGHEYQKSAKYKKQWSEKGESQLKTHDDKELLTMEDIYTKADEWARTPLNDEKIGEDDIEADYIFETDNQGIISKTGLLWKNCNDDCFKGHKIKDFKWL